MIRAAALAVALAPVLALVPAGPARAQTVDLGVLGQALNDQRPAGPEMASGTEVTLRALDKVSGAISDLTVAVGASVTHQRLSVSVSACRYPSDNPASDAFAFLTITDATRGESLFQGWMIASSPALNALDHPRMDIWVLGCR
jgi:hypothetical protein